MKIKSILFLLLALMVSCLFTACSSDDGEQDIETTLEKSVIGSWYYSKDNHIYVLKVSGNGSGSLTAYEYESKQWTEQTTALQYTISNSTVTVVLQGESAWQGTLAVTGDNMSITKESEIFMFTKFDGGADKIDNLKAEIEENWQEVLPDDNFNEETYFISEENARAALDALYSYLRTYEYNQLNLENIRIYGIDLKNASKTITPSLEEVENTWQSAYRTISLANHIASALQGKTEYESYINEALAIRSLVYYNITTLWGNVPYTETVTDAAVDNPQVYTSEQVANVIMATLSSLDTFTNADYGINKETVKALQGEIALWKGDKPAALTYLEDCTADFSVLLSEETTPVLFNLLGEKLPNYTSNIITLLKKEANYETDRLLTDWQALGTPVWGYWAMLKRTGNAITVSGCEEHELLMPIPRGELYVNPALTQNPGY